MDETRAIRRGRLGFEAAVVVACLAASAGLLFAGMAWLSLGPVGLAASVIYVEVSTFDRIEALGEGRVRLRRRLGPVEVTLESDAHVRQSWFGPRTVFLCQGDERWKIFGTVGGSVALNEWIDSLRRRDD